MHVVAPTISICRAAPIAAVSARMPSRICMLPISARPLPTAHPHTRPCTCWSAIRTCWSAPCLPIFCSPTLPAVRQLATCPACASSPPMLVRPYAFSTSCLAAGIRALLRLHVEPCQQTPRLYAEPSDPQPLLLPPAAPPGLIPDLGNHIRVVFLDPHKRQYYSYCYHAYHTCSTYHTSWLHLLHLLYLLCVCTTIPALRANHPAQTPPAPPSVAG